MHHPERNVLGVKGMGRLVYFACRAEQGLSAKVQNRLEIKPCRSGTQSKM